MRQVLAHLTDQNTMIEHFMGGYGIPTYGPTPIYPEGQPVCQPRGAEQPLPVLGFSRHQAPQGARVAGQPREGGRMRSAGPELMRAAPA